MTVHVPILAPSGADAPEWSLDDLYAGPDDPAIESDLAEARAGIEQLVKFKGGFVAARANPERLGLLLSQSISLYDRTTDLLLKPGAYASLAASVARADPLWAKFESDLRARFTRIAADAVFLTLEINELEEWEIEAAFKASPDAARWRPWVRRVRLMRPHELTSDMERLLLDRSPAISNWSRLYDETLAGLAVVVDAERYTLAEALNRLSDPNPGVRERTAGGLADVLERHTPVLSLCLNTLAFEKQVEDRWRKFSNPADSRHVANEVDIQAVEALEAAVVDAFPRVPHRYYRLKAKLLGKEVLDFWDRNAPIDQAPPRRYGWEEAKSIVLDAFASLAPDFAEKARPFFDHPWIDARPRPGKGSGAYSHPVASSAHPYVFMNFMGERRDVLTLAHELGHAVHQTLAAPAGVLLSDTPLTMAETASIFGEGLVFERLLSESQGPERRALLAGRIEDGLNTVFRQIAFHRFEGRFHLRRNDGEVRPADIQALWLESMGESLGPAVTLNPGYQHYWAYVSHFVHSPFYVYAYAFADLLVSALMEARRHDPIAFAPHYQALLAGGGTKTYFEALQPFGLDPRRKTFWAEGCARLERLVDEFEALV